MFVTWRLLREWSSFVAVTKFYEEFRYKTNVYKKTELNVYKTTTHNMYNITSALSRRPNKQII